MKKIKLIRITAGVLFILDFLKYLIVNLQYIQIVSFSGFLKMLGIDTLAIFLGIAFSILLILDKKTPVKIAQAVRVFLLVICLIVRINNIRRYGLLDFERLFFIRDAIFPVISGVLLLIALFQEGKLSALLLTCASTFLYILLELDICFGPVNLQTIGVYLLTLLTNLPFLVANVLVGLYIFKCESTVHKVQTKEKNKENTVDQLIELKAMLDNGYIDRVDFELKKKELMGHMK